MLEPAGSSALLSLRPTRQQAYDLVGERLSYYVATSSVLAHISSPIPKHTFFYTYIHVNTIVGLPE